jgi:hypothetical protein
MRTYDKIQIGDVIHSNWYGDGTVADLNETGTGQIKFGRFFVMFREFEIFYANGWMLSV